MIEIVNCRAFKSSLTRRRYFTRKSAIKAEATALIAARHPSEQAEFSGDFGECSYSGFHWTEIHRSDVLLRRVMRLVEKGTEK